MQAPAQPIDWPGIRANAVTLGIRGAARAAAADLSPEEQERFVERVMKRASREGWESARLSVMSAEMSANRNLSANQAKPLSAKVRNGAESVALTLVERKETSILHQSKYLVRASKVLADTPDGDLLAVVAEGQGLATMRSKLWPEQQVAVGVQVNLGRLDVG